MTCANCGRRTADVQRYVCRLCRQLAALSVAPAGVGKSTPAGATTTQPPT